METIDERGIEERFRRVGQRSIDTDSTISIVAMNPPHYKIHEVTADGRERLHYGYWKNHVTRFWPHVELDSDEERIYEDLMMLAFSAMQLAEPTARSIVLFTLNDRPDLFDHDDQTEEPDKLLKPHARNAWSKLGDELRFQNVGLLWSSGDTGHGKTPWQAVMEPYRSVI